MLEQLIKEYTVTGKNGFENEQVGMLQVIQA